MLALGAGGTSAARMTLLRARAQEAARPPAAAVDVTVTPAAMPAVSGSGANLTP
jgi:hypothetical protein